MTTNQPDITPTDSRYVPLTQQPYCCAPTCIQMVMIAHGIPLQPAEKIGYYMGLLAAPDDRELLWHPRNGDKPPAGWGTQVGKPQFAPNKAFERLNIPLRLSFQLIDKINGADQLAKILAAGESSGDDILVCYDYAVLYDRENHTGHLNLFDRIDGRTVRLIDPEYKVPKWREVDVDKLYKAMDFHGADNSSGLWRLSLTT